MFSHFLDSLSLLVLGRSGLRVKGGFDHGLVTQPESRLVFQTAAETCPALTLKRFGFGGLGMVSRLPTRTRAPNPESKSKPPIQAAGFFGQPDVRRVENIHLASLSTAPIQLAQLDATLHLYCTQPSMECLAGYGATLRGVVERSRNGFLSTCQSFLGFLRALRPPPMDHWTIGPPA